MNDDKPTSGKPTSGKPAATAAPLLSSDAPFVKGNQTQAGLVLAEEDDIYDLFAGQTSLDGFPFR